jgi:DNA mismatch repair protein MutS
MDEIGRGTSTYDGLALANACASHLARHNRAFTLFATHYFELTLLPKEHDGIANVHLDAVEYGEQLVFMHAVKEGPANRSFGLQVAALAGLPRQVIADARSILSGLEAGTAEPRPLASAEPSGNPQLGLFAPPAPSPVEEAMRALEPDAMSPREALEALYRLKKML